MKVLPIIKIIQRMIKKNTSAISVPIQLNIIIHCHSTSMQCIFNKNFLVTHASSKQHAGPIYLDMLKMSIEEKILFAFHAIKPSNCQV